MNQSISEEFREKCNESFARGGFLTTDYPGEDGVNKWELDPDAIEEWVLSKISEAIDTERKELREKVEGMKRKIDYSYQNVPEEWRADPDNVEAYGFNQAVDRFLSFLEEK